jgi:hypothetical protein
MRNLNKGEKSRESTATLQVVALILFLTFVTAFSISIADDLSGHDATAGATTSLIPPRYAVIDLGTNLIDPFEISNGGWVLGYGFYDAGFWGQAYRWVCLVVRDLRCLRSPSVALRVW